MPLEGENIYDYGTRKYGRTKQQGDQNRANITQLGKEAGFTFNFTNESRVVNTRDAHTLLDHLRGMNKQGYLKHFSLSRKISRIELYLNKRLKI